MFFPPIFKHFFTQKLTNRASVIHQSEVKMWDQITLDIMTEESDDPDDPSVIVEHKATWRSKRKYYL